MTADGFRFGAGLGLAVSLGVTTGCPADKPGGDGAAEASATDPGSDPDEESGEDTGGHTTAPGTDTEGPDPGDDTEGATDPGVDTDCTFVCDDTGPAPDCSPWDQDCPEGEKCMPWASDGGSSWNALKCVQIDPAAKQPGDSCTVEGNGVSGIDDCDIGSMCWGVDPETNQGTCVDFCGGSQANPTCDDPSTTCVIANEGVLILCLPTCDPLLQDCQDPQACYPVNDKFACAPDASGEMGLYGDPCEYLNVCDPGLFCASADSVPGCQGSTGCCSEFCDIDAADAGSVCSGQSGGQDCVPWYEENQAPPGFESIGGCAIP